MLKKKASANSKQSYNRGYVREVRRWSAKPFTRVQIPLPSPTIGVKMRKVTITLWFEKDVIDDADVINALQNQIDDGCLDYDNEEDDA